MGEARPDEREINIPGAERTTVTNFGASTSHDDGPGLPTAASGVNISPERSVIRWMYANDDGSGLPTAASGGNISPERPVIRWMSLIVHYVVYPQIEFGESRSTDVYP